MGRLGGISFAESRIILAVLGVVTGILFFFANSGERTITQISSILLGSWLVAGGLRTLSHLRFSGSDVLLATLSVAAGVMVLITRR